MTDKKFTPRKAFIFLTLCLVISVTGCVGNHSEPRDMETSEKETTTVGLDNAPDSSQPIENLSFYLNDSQRFESRAIYDQTEKDAIVQRFYVIDFAWVGGGSSYSCPSIAITYRDQGEDVTQIFELQASEMDKLYFQKNKVAEIVTVRPAYSPICTSYNNINYDENGTNPRYRPYT